MENLQLVEKMVELANGKKREELVELVISSGFVPPATNRSIWKILTRLSEGNNKLQADSTSKFLIWNLPAITTCPFATKLCMSNCYARKSERQYPQVLPFRELNYKIARSSVFTKFIKTNIEYHMNKRSFQGKKVYFRIHESGDFFNQSYMLEWFNVVKAVKKAYDYRLTFTAYTKSLVYATGIKIPDNLKMYYSVWDDTLPAYINIAKARRISMFEAVEAENVRITDTVCIGDCSLCKKCYDLSESGNIKVIIH